MAMVIIRIFKSWGGRVPDRRWVNNYECEIGNLALTALDGLVNGIVAAEKTLHGDMVNFLSATISTWEEDSTPYNPLALRTLELSGVGANAVTAGTGMDSNVAFIVGFQPTLGRNGRRFYRGCLTEGDVETGNDGRMSIIPVSGHYDTGSRMTAFRTAIGPYLSAGADPSKIVLASNSGGPVVQRAVASVKSVGVTVNRRNHRYFDRA